MKAFCTADFVLAAVTLAAALLGLFSGFSGALGFCAGTTAAGLTIKFGYAPLAVHLKTPWMTAVAMLVLTLLAFGLVRAIVKRVVKGLLAQPADAIFGSLIAAATGGVIGLAALFAARNLLSVTVHSTIYSAVAGFLDL